MNKILSRLFGITVLLTVFAGGLSLLGYLYAFFVGVEQAEIICHTIHKEFYPIMIQVTSVGVGIGLVLMYLTKTKALSINK